LNLTNLVGVYSSDSHDEGTSGDRTILTAAGSNVNNRY
jgi:hypothetical protein